MLTSITPLGERGRGQRYAVTVTSYVVGSVVGGTLAGALLGGLGSLLVWVLPVPVLAVAAAVLLVAAGFDARGATMLGRRQVDQDWLPRFRGWVYGLGFGVQLGFGAVTVVTSAATLALAAVLLLTGSPAAGAWLGALFGLSRALPVLALRHVQQPDQLRAAARRWSAAAPAASRAVVGLLAAAAAFALGALVWS